MSRADRAVDTRLCFFRKMPSLLTVALPWTGPQQIWRHQKQIDYAKVSAIEDMGSHECSWTSRTCAQVEAEAPSRMPRVPGGRSVDLPDGGWTSGLSLAEPRLNFPGWKYASQQKMPKGGPQCWGNRRAFPSLFTPSGLGPAHSDLVCLRLWKSSSLLSTQARRPHGR